MYGCVLWNFENKAIEHFCTAWRKGLRRVWGLPYDSHSDILPLLSDSLPILDELCRRSVAFINTCLISDSPTVRAVTSYGLYAARMLSPLGRNAFFCCERYGVRVGQILNISKRTITELCYSLVPLDRWLAAELLLELIFIKEGTFYLHSNCTAVGENVFGIDDIDLLIRHSSTA